VGGNSVNAHLNARRSLQDVEDVEAAFNNVVQHPTVRYPDWLAFRISSANVSIVEFSHARNNQGNFQQQINTIIAADRFVSGGAKESQIIAPSITASGFNINGVNLRSTSLQPWTGGSPLSYTGNIRANSFICDGSLSLNSPFRESTGLSNRGIRVILNTTTGKKYFIARLNQG
jgi:hypothetical protein